jgi:hypothetical protein
MNINPAFENIKNRIIQETEDDVRSNALIRFLENEKFGIRQIGYDSYNYTVADCDTFIRTESDFTSNLDLEKENPPVLHLVIPDRQSYCGRFYLYDDLSEETMDLINAHLWGTIN